MSKQNFDRNSDVLVVEQVGRTRSITPEGFLLCEGVRIARTGPMLYMPSEMRDIDPGASSMIVVERGADVLFADDCIASFNGKPVTYEHPDEMVNPKTWRETSVGTVLNPRRGEGAEAEYLIADLLITDASTIEAVQGRPLQVSCGYDSDRVQVKPGVGRTTKVIGNHVALVEKGRCGPACSIQDSEVSPMAKRTVWDRLRTAFKAKDEAAFEEELKTAQDEDGGGNEPSPPVVVHVHNAPGDKPAPPAEDQNKDESEADPVAAVVEAIKALTERVAALEGKSKDEAPEDKAEGAPAKDEGPDKPEGDMPTKDSGALVEEFKDTLSRAELLAPGISLPVFDAKAKPKMTVDAMCGLRKRALEKALSDDQRKGHVTAVLGAKPDVAKMTCDAAAIAFRAASELARAANNRPGLPEGVESAGRMTTANYQKMIEARRKG